MTPGEQIAKEIRELINTQIAYSQLDERVVEESWDREQKIRRMHNTESYLAELIDKLTDHG